MEHKVDVCVAPPGEQGEVKTAEEPMGTQTCPNCGKRSYTSVLFGASVIRCKRCRARFKVTVEMLRSV